MAEVTIEIKTNETVIDQTVIETNETAINETDQPETKSDQTVIDDESSDEENEIENDHLCDCCRQKEDLEEKEKEEKFLNKYNLTNEELESIDEIVRNLKDNVCSHGTTKEFHSDSLFGFMMSGRRRIDVTDISLRSYKTNQNERIYHFAIDYRLFTKDGDVEEMEDEGDFTDHTINLAGGTTLKESIIEGIIKYKDIKYCSNCYIAGFNLKKCKNDCKGKCNPSCQNKVSYCSFPMQNSILECGKCVKCVFNGISDRRFAEDTCCVCREVKNKNELELLKCSDKHIVCKNCWSKIKNRKCPICRKPSK
jgi:hypothetical protein